MQLKYKLRMQSSYLGTSINFPIHAPPNFDFVSLAFGCNKGSIDFKWHSEP
jgi:hypothetical protein